MYEKQSTEPWPIEFCQNTESNEWNQISSFTPDFKYVHDIKYVQVRREKMGICLPANWVQEPKMPRKSEVSSLI